MNNHKFKIAGLAACVLIAVVCAFLIWNPNRITKKDPKVVPSHKEPRPPAHEDLVNKRIALIREMAKSDPIYQSRIPLDFYGKVVDQHKQPVPNAKVAIQYIPDPNGNKWYELVTSADGTFTYGGVTGQFLFVKIGAPVGYGGVDSTCSADYNYAVPSEFNFHVPDSDRPVVFKVWKYSGPEPMNHWILRARNVKTNGKVQWFDLANGKSDGRSLGISVDHHAPPVDDFERESWITYTVSAGEECGVLETNDDPMFYAPESEFQNTIVHEFRHKVGKTSYDQAGRFRLYFKCSDGNYSAIVIDISRGVVNHRTSDGKINNYDGEATIVVYRNPSGSRNLEYVESLSIQDGKSGH